MGNKRKQFGSSKNTTSLALTRQIKRQKKIHFEEQSRKSKDASNYDDTSRDIFSSLESLDESKSTGIQSTVAEKEDISEFEITTEPNISTCQSFQIEGRRIVDFNYFYDQMKTLSDHNPGLGCTISNIQIIREKLIGLQSTRCHAAVVAFNTGKAQYNLYKANFEKSPSKSIKLLELRRSKCNQNRSHRSGSKKKLVFPNDRNDYGERCQKPDLTPEQYETARNLFLQNLKSLVENRYEVERDTVLQAESALWLELRRGLLTASTFSKVCKRRCNINSAPLVKSLVYSYSLNGVPSIEYGKTNETIAIKQLEQQEGIVVQKCGLFIDQNYFFLGASPDCLFDEGIVEIKCPYSARNMDAEQAILQKKINFWKIDGSINTNHDWYFQIQGQLHISQKNLKCYCKTVINLRDIANENKVPNVFLGVFSYEVS
ncbi:unnamed protein product [Parnassius apollo]|uniref:(apollo) hypothetical protein n=1 Tax=Parnassius apollo TaxID=110799 RepID=A0A8S3Y877_PARAO|nr:unnamed protein product [Parnassius apollo]